MSRPDACIQACCEKGPELCQFAWFFADKCLLVGCSKKESSLCEPAEFSKSSITSTYYRIQHSGQVDDQDNQDDGTFPSTTPSHSTTTVSSEEETPHNDLTDNPVRPTEVTGVTPSLIESQAPPTTVARPPPLTTTTEKAATGIIVATDGDTDVSLPTNTAKIYGNTWPKPKSPGDYLYRWEKVAGPEQGTIVGKNDKDAMLEDLVPGVYKLRLKVTNWKGSEWGEGFIIVTVHQASYVNSPPVPVILPASESVIKLPQDSIVLDAGETTDDRGPTGLRFHWEEVAGPLSSNLESDSPLLRLSGLTEGVHEYKLTVTDLDEAVATATARVTVEGEKDYPPTAHAGNPVVLHLPNNEAVLDGSGSTDEGELKYKWTYLSGPGGGDMEGANKAKLHVYHLPLGDHRYLLTVTDSSGQLSTDTVSVIVTAEDNKPPVANAGGNKTLVYPESSVVLNGSKSMDDYLISVFKWTQILGPTDVSLSGVATNALTVSGLHIDEAVGSPTRYLFRLTVVDYRNLTDSDTVQIIYRKNPKIPPVVSAGPDVNITLPQSAVVLDGSGSHDDFGIVSYQWERSKDSPAAGRVVDGSDKAARLILSDLVNGTYRFTLTVTNVNKQTATSTVKLMVLPNPSDRHLLQVHLDGDITQFTGVDVDRFKRALSYLLYDGSEENIIHVVSVSPAGIHIMVEFFAVGGTSKKIVNTTAAYYKLTEKGQDYWYTSYHIVHVDMKVCQLPCSGHGTCNLRTKKCQCSTFWMENPFKSRMGRMESNCEWSVFYVTLVVLGIVAVFLFFFWLICCCCLRRRRRSRSKRRIRYAILDHKGDPESMQMLPKEYKQTSLMVSESETEEEILFESSRKLNNDTKKGGKNNQVKNGKILTGQEKFGNQEPRSSNNTD